MKNFLLLAALMLATGISQTAHAQTTTKYGGNVGTPDGKSQKY